MVVKLQTKKKINEIIEKGGRTKSENSMKDILKFNIHLPYRLAELVDKNRDERLYKISRHQWILEAIKEKLGI